MEREQLVAKIDAIEAVRDSGGLWSPHSLAQAKECLRQFDEGLPVTGFVAVPARPPYSISELLPASISR